MVPGFKRPVPWQGTEGWPVTAIHEHLAVRAIGNTLRSLRATAGGIATFESQNLFPASDDWFVGWSAVEAREGVPLPEIGSEIGEIPFVLWGAVNGDEIRWALDALLSRSCPLVVVANLGFPFGERGARRYAEHQPASPIGLHPFSGEPLAQGVYPELDWDPPSPPSLVQGLSQVASDHRLRVVDRGTVEPFSPDDWLLWDLGETTGLAVVVAAAWLRAVGLGHTDLSELRAIIERGTVSYTHLTLPTICSV